MTNIVFLTCLFSLFTEIGVLMDGSIPDRLDGFRMYSRGPVEPSFVPTWHKQLMNHLRYDQVRCDDD
jgi:hypothetical protein